ncbi:MAG: SDR family oxidoreductase [Burkholderiaceae bacterium]|nr:SDR family oxidoreductase [Burkholderiaceae bacterium]
MDFGLNGKTALVIGGGSGLGAASARALSKEGAHVVLVGRRPEVLAASAAQMSGKSTQLVWDVSNPDAAAEKIAALRAQVSSIDILINNTGGPPPSSAAGQPLALWSTHFRGMVLSLIAITDAVLPDMLAAGWGRVVTIASSGVVAPIPNLALSNALRSSLVGWSKTLARELAPKGITVNMALPGRIATDRLRTLDEGKAKRESRAVDEVIKESMASIPVGRYGEPDEFGAAVAFLASRQAAYITGSMMRIDGGMIASV